MGKDKKVNMSYVCRNMPGPDDTGIARQLTGMMSQIQVAPPF